jgi:hypothetical protein
VLDFIAAFCCLSHNIVASRVIYVLCLSLAAVLQNCAISWFASAVRFPATLGLFWSL